MHFTLVKINPPDAAPSHGFDDVMLPLYHALRRLGFAVEILCNRVNPRSRNIVFGSCIAPRRTGRMLPPGSIIFNLEQIVQGSKWCNHDYLTHLREFTVWDYSPANLRALADLGVRRGAHLPLGYVPEMTRLPEGQRAEIDVLFYGLLTERRHTVIARMVREGLRVIATQEAFGNLRDALLLRSALVLNIHQFLPAKLELVRLGYVWANKKPVLSEARPDTEIPDHLGQACLFTDYANLCTAAGELLANPAALRKQGEEGYRAFASRPLEAGLKALVGQRLHSAGGASCLTGVTGATGGEWLIRDKGNTD